MNGVHAPSVSGNLTPEAWRTLPLCSLESKIKVDLGVRRKIITRAA